MGFHTPRLRTVNPIHTMINTTSRDRARLARVSRRMTRRSTASRPPAHTNARAPAPQHMSAIFTTSLSAKASAKVRLSPRASHVHPSTRERWMLMTSARGSIRSRRAMTTFERRRGRRSSDDVGWMEFIPVRFRRHRSTTVSRRRRRDDDARSRWITRGIDPTDRGGSHRPTD